MKPITDNEEFKAIWQETENDLNEVHPGILVTLKQYNKTGALTAQSILQKEHEAEKIEILDWLKGQIDMGSISVDNEYWFGYPAAELDSVQLLQLFRERDKA